MCGLISFLSSKNAGMFDSDLSAFEQLLYADVLRGKDSTGVFVVNSTGKEIRGAKEASPAYEFMRHNDWKALRQFAVNQGRGIIGHNRAATKGSVTDDNAHPFREGNIVMVHNGTLYGDYAKQIDVKVDVDSHAICHLLNEHGTDEVEKVINKIEGAYALIWFDKRDGSYNFLRNAQRPLYHCYNNDGWWWGSEDSMLEWVLDRTNKDQAEVPSMLPEHTHCKMIWKEQKWYITNTKVTKAPKETPAVHVTYPQWHEWAEQYANGYQGCTGDCDGETAADVFEEVNRRVHRPQQHMRNVLQLPNMQATPPNRITPIITDFEKRLSEQCGKLSTSLDWMADAKEFPEGQWFQGYLVDYVMRDKADHKKGAFVYAIPACHTALFRCYVEYDGQNDFENTLVESCMGSMKMEFKVAGKHWHLNPNSKDAKVRTGWGFYYSSDMRIVPRVLTKENEHA